MRTRFRADLLRAAVALVPGMIAVSCVPFPDPSGGECDAKPGIQIFELPADAGADAGPADCKQLCEAYGEVYECRFVTVSDDGGTARPAVACDVRPYC